MMEACFLLWDPRKTAELKRAFVSESLGAILIAKRPTHHFIVALTETPKSHFIIATFNSRREPDS
jgi:hypothetical protein